MSDLSLKSAKHLTSHILQLIFSDGHSDYDKYKCEKCFLNYEIIDGDLTWDDYTMIFPVEDL